MKTVYYPDVKPHAICGQILLNSDATETYARHQMSDGTTRIYHVQDRRQVRIDTLPDDTYPVGRTFTFNGVEQV